MAKAQKVTKRLKAQKAKRTFSHVKVNARSGVSIPSYAIVSSERFKTNLGRAKRIAEKSAILNKSKIAI